MKHALPLLLAMAASPALAQEDAAAGLADINPRAAQIVDQATAQCAEATEEGAALQFQWGAVESTDIDGDNDTGPNGGPDDMVVDFNRILCPGAPNLWSSAAAGAPIHLVRDGQSSHGWVARDWQVVRAGPQLPAVVLLTRHGAACGGEAEDGCVQAIVVTPDGRFLTQNPVR